MAGTSRRNMRWWIPALIVAGFAGLVGWLFLKQDVSRYFALLAAAVFGIPLLGLWYALGTQLPAKKKWRGLGIVFLLVGGAVAVVALCTRWEGSMSGGAVPNLVWKWLPKADARLVALKGSGQEASRQDGGPSFAQFLGPDRNGVLTWGLLDADWSAHPPEELWRREIGAGWSGFSVESGRAVTQEQRGELELVSCYDLASGEPLWVHENGARFSEMMGGDGPRANPTLHEGKVYAMGATGILDCLELSDGAPVWSRNVLAEHGAENVMYGKANSPLIVDDLVIVTGGKKGKPNVLAYHRITGEPVWAAGDDEASYASPIVATLAGRRQVVSLNQNSVTGHDLATGEILWKWDWPAKMPKSALPQVVGENRLFVSASYGMGTALLEVAEKDGEFAVAKVWKNLEMKTKFSNVCIWEGFAYGLDEGRLACVEVATGKRKWRGANYGYGQNMMIGRHLLVQSERGYVALVEANPEKFVELGRVEALSDKTWNNPTLAGEYLLVRNDKEAACYRVKLNP